jgi:hypothetical protein
MFKKSFSKCNILSFSVTKRKTPGMNQLENAFLTGVEQNQQKMLRICSVYADDEDEKKDLFSGSTEISSVRQSNGIGYCV